MSAVGVKYWAVLTGLLIAVSATTLHSLFIFMNNATSVFIALAAAFDWHVRAKSCGSLGEGNPECDPSCRPVFPQVSLLLVRASLLSSCCCQSCT